MCQHVAVAVAVVVVVVFFFLLCNSHDVRYLTRNVLSFLPTLQAKGLGYAISDPQELKFVKEVATATGVIFDPVYRYLHLCYP